MFFSDLPPLMFDSPEEGLGLSILFSLSKYLRFSCALSGGLIGPRYTFMSFFLPDFRPVLGRSLGHMLLLFRTPHSGSECLICVSRVACSCLGSEQGILDFGFLLVRFSGCSLVRFYALDMSLEEP